MSIINKCLKKTKTNRSYDLTPFKLLPKNMTDNHDHRHICFVARILRNLNEHCPYWGVEGFSPEEGIDYEAGGTTCECDNCKYFGQITSTKDGLKFFMDERIVETFKAITEDNK